MWLIQTFSKTIYPEFMEKKENSGSVQTSAVFRTHYHVDYRMVCWSKTF